MTHGVEYEQLGEIPGLYLCQVLRKLFEGPLFLFFSQLKTMTQQLPLHSPHAHHAGPWKRRENSLVTFHRGKVFQKSTQKYFIFHINSFVFILNKLTKACQKAMLSSLECREFSLLHFYSDHSYYSKKELLLCYFASSLLYFVSNNYINLVTILCLFSEDSIIRI